MGEPSTRGALDRTLVNLYSIGMRTVGLFEAKTKLSEICGQVDDTGETVVVTRRGKPWVRIEPIAESSLLTVRERRAEYLAGEKRQKGGREPEFEPAPRSKDLPREGNLDA